MELLTNTFIFNVTIIYNNIKPIYFFYYLIIGGRSPTGALARLVAAWESRPGRWRAGSKSIPRWRWTWTSRLVRYPCQLTSSCLKPVKGHLVILSNPTEPRIGLLELGPKLVFSQRPQTLVLFNIHRIESSCIGSGWAVDLWFSLTNALLKKTV